MATFSGTTQKCKACERTVYWVEQLTADNKVYHKSCFRCHHCKGTLKLSNYSSFEGALYCKPHFDQLYKLTGSLDKSFAGAPRTVRVDRSVDQGYTNNKVSSLFGGTQEKCVTCKKTVYPIEKVTVDGTPYHKNCFRCTHGGCVISPSNYVAHEQKLYCRHHHKQLFKQTGNFSQFNKNEQAKRKTENTASEANSNGLTDNTKHEPSANGTTDNTKQESSANGTTENTKQESSANGTTENTKQESDANGKIENTKQESYANGSTSQPEA